MNIFRKKKDQDLDEEIQAHLRMAANDLGGVDAAKKDFGNIALVKEVTRDAWRGNSLHSWFKDVSFALRGLPYQDPSRLVSLWEEVSPQVPNFSSSGATLGAATVGRRSTVSIANLADYREGLSELAGDAVTSIIPSAWPTSLYARRATPSYCPRLFYSSCGASIRTGP
jgi:hypothetical protein